MPKIQVLDKHTAELIAAGEVVERPSSVVKELMENTIDAGATAVTVEIRSGGIRYIGITDNGSGIAREDVPTAFLRHATSKIRREEDLEAIGTLGFRGEALASIAAVSRVELVTRTADEMAGTRYLLEGGEEVSLEDAGCPQGTTICVRDLFYNVPARMKFLKKDVSEANAVAGVVERLALSHPEVSFRFIREGREELLTPGDGNPKSCVYAVFGRDFSSGLIDVEYTLGGIHVHGFISKPTASRANRTMQHFFINGRYVKTRTAMAALEQAFKGSIMVGKFPACVLYIDMSPETVDANVHPAKIEVRFVNEKPVFEAVYHGVRSALEAGDAPKQAVLPQVNPPVREEPLRPATARRTMEAVVQAPVVLPQAEPSGATGMGTTIPAESRIPPKSTLRDRGEAVVYYPNPSIDIERTEKEEPVPGQTTLNQQFPQLDEDTDTPPSPPPQKMETALKVGETPGAVPAGGDLREEESKEAIRYLGEAFRTYVVVEWGESLYFIDKHAAHERILYNRLKETAHSEAQMLLSPVSVLLSREEYTALTENRSLLAQAGFEVEEFGGNTLLVRAVPMMLQGGDIAAAVQEIAGGFLSGRREITMDKLDWIYHSTACRAAVKAGNLNHPEELRQLAERILLHDDIRYCPHGRPVCFELTRKELEKQFGRIV